METARDILFTIFKNIRDLSTFIIDPDSRFFWANNLAYILLALIPFCLYYKKGKIGLKSFFAYVFPKEAYSHPSLKLDLDFFLLKKILFPLGFTFSFLSFNFLTLQIYHWFSKTISPPWDKPTTHWLIHASIVLLLLMQQDFSTYVGHRIFHKNKSLWEFHAVHHSAPVLNPLTLYRVHPFSDFLQQLITGAITSIGSGIILYAFYGDLKFLTLMEINLLQRIFTFVGANFRHSHIWIAYPKWLSHILMSPAQHQIHHSKNPEHYNKNLGEIFALWDWMFGTLLVPSAKMELEFGLADEKAYKHDSFKAALLQPMLKIWIRLLALSPKAINLLT